MDPDPPRHFSGALPTPSTTTQGSRSRRREQNSSEESETLSSVVCAKYRAAHPVLRPLPLEVANLPTSTSTSTTSSSTSTSDVLDRAEDTILERTREILEQYDLFDDQKTEINIVARRVPNEHHTAVPTVFILTTWVDHADTKDTWKDAVHDLVNFIQDTFNILGTTNTTLHVEMMAFELSLPKYLGPVLDEPKLDTDWPKIRSLVCHCLESYDTTCYSWQTIAIFRLGFLPDHSMNPITVYVSVSQISDETQWEVIIHHIQQTLDNHGWGSLHVLIEHNTVTTSTFHLVPPEGIEDEILERAIDKNLVIEGKYSVPVDLGTSISMKKNIKKADGTLTYPMSGTLGCYIELKTKTNTDWNVFGLTNWHVVRPGFDGFSMITKVKKNDVGPGEVKINDVGPAKTHSDLWKRDQKGWSPRNPAPELAESPSRTEHNYTIWWLKREIKTLEDKKADPTSQFTPEDEEDLKALEKDRDEKIKFFDEDHNLFGRLYAGSGFRRTANNHRLDWALIKPSEFRQGSIFLPGRETWKAKYPRKNWPSSETFNRVLEGQSSSICHEIDDEARLNTYPLVKDAWKVGTTTEATAGYFHKYKPFVKMTDEAYMGLGPSKEYVFQAYKSIGEKGNNTFSLPGDSGSVVFDHKGGIVGLLFSGQTPNNVRLGYSLVTPIEHVFDDIKRWSKGQITDIRVMGAEEDGEKGGKEGDGKGKQEDQDVEMTED
ncbi:hypothetical protein NW762_005294 [Fusarium torreyae]|uniref:Serine protease n=1 Tax=Fusarium torreyae TaxID=1237075 RepID=A0A9W8S677_9HYPO|nr:hypothetical protein NW762_005294 [Fusarium torreyae]